MHTAKDSTLDELLIVFNYLANRRVESPGLFVDGSDYLLQYNEYDQEIKSRSELMKKREAVLGRLGLL